MSSIKPKKGQCIDCVARGDKKEKYITAGRCGIHYPQYRNFINRNKKVKAIAKVVPMFKTKGLANTLEASIELAKWFKEKEELVAANPFCSECGEFIPPFRYRHAVAHIFPKALFPSVASAEWNFLILAAGCCHDKSHTIQSFKKMKVWPEAVRRYNTFKDQITETHKYKTLFENAVHSNI